ncbi:hypothetical protein VQ042_04875 [Aurantimonas sp. A2-1-M11]|uniref:hypothetical protein n=1 Tax=Aurantimonas sp. A2-1-M11 TaxID=3113712 RepID=UPI002F949EA7
MKTTAIFTAALLGTSVFSFGALAQSSTPGVPGSETVIEQNNAAERDDVAEGNGVTGVAPEVNEDQATIVPGSESQTDTAEAQERDDVAEDNGMTTSSTTPEGSDDVLVPGSGATFTPGEAPTTQQGKALQDGSSTEATQ